MRQAVRRPGAAWVALAALLGLGAVVVTALATGVAGAGAPLTSAPLARTLDWQAALGLAQPWRLWTSAWVHWSGPHLLVNVLGAMVVAFTGWRARLPAGAALAWFLAWPGTQLAMAALGSPRLAAAMPHYGGLSGVLHAGAVVLGSWLLWPIAQRAGPARMRPDPWPVTEGPWALTTLEEAIASRPSRPVAVAPSSFPRERWIGAAIVAGTLCKVILEAPWNLAPRPSPALDIAVAPIAHACGIVAGVLAWALVRMGLAAGCTAPNRPA